MLIQPISSARLANNSQISDEKIIMKNIVITGGTGFIGSHVVRLFVNQYPEYKIINLDVLTYAGNLANLKDIEDKPKLQVCKDQYL